MSIEISGEGWMVCGPLLSNPPQIAPTPITCVRLLSSVTKVGLTPLSYNRRFHCHNQSTLFQRPCVLTITAAPTSDPTPRRAMSDITARSIVTLIVFFVISELE